MRKPVVCINGSRTITSINLDRFINPNHIGTLVLGGANGIDTIAENWAKRHNVNYIIFYPEWARYGKSAGMRRNKLMIDISDILISFWDGKSVGTKQTIDYAQRLNRKIIIHLVQDLD